MLKQQFSQFNRILQGIEKIYENYAKSVGLTYMSLTVLEIICHATESCTQKNICEDSHYNKQIVNSIIKGFIEDGYVELKEAVRDRRNKYVVLTESGKEYADRILTPLSELENEALLTLTDDERILLLSLLDKCYKGYISAIK